MKREANEEDTYCLSVYCEKRKKCMRHHSHYNFSKKGIKYKYFAGNKRENEECTEFIK